MKRREFIKKSIISSGGLIILPGRIRVGSSVVTSSYAKNSPILLQVFLRGGADGLNITIPYGDPAYKKLRSTIRIPEPGKNHGALDLDGFFGLHPKLPSFLEFYNQGNLAVIHACGSTNETRSHFDAMDYMESGSSTEKLHDGWLNRYLGQSSPSPNVFRATAIGTAMPYTLSGHATAICLAGLEALQLDQSVQMDIYLDAVKELYSDRGDTLGEIALRSLEAIELGRSKLDPGSYQPENGAEYKETEFSQGLGSLAQIIKADIGLEIASIDLNGWDTHTNQGNGESGELATALTILDDGIRAFALDMQAYMHRIVILIVSEFGRTARQNGSGGTDHGHGTAMFSLGNKINGGRVLGDWPGLSDSQLYQSRDLAVTTDFRRLFAEVLENHMGCTNISAVFPGFNYSSDPSLGLFG